MQIYLPIAELSVNVLIILGMGGAVGFLSGMFGVGGGFLMTPLLIFAGIPPAVAVATEANQIVASSVSGALVHWRRRAVDIKMGVVLLNRRHHRLFHRCLDLQFIAHAWSGGPADLALLRRVPGRHRRPDAG